MPPIADFGNYYLVVDYTGSRGSYTISFDTAEPLASLIELGDAPGTTETPYRLEVGETFRGNMNSKDDDSSDDDWIEVSLVAGEDYRFELTEGSISSADLKLYDAFGSLVSNPTGSTTTTSFIEMTVSESGSYYIAVDSSYSGSYTISIHDQSGVRLSGSVTFWQNGDAIDGAEMSIVSLPDGEVELSVLTAIDGGYDFEPIAESLYALRGNKVLGSEDGDAVQPADALAALKIAFGMNPNGTGGTEVSPYQYLAADVDRDGVVEPADALNILKMAFGMQTETEKEWVIVPESVGGEEMSNGSVDWSAAQIPDVTLDQDLDVQLVGVLMGDVDGSWMA